MTDVPDRFRRSAIPTHAAAARPRPTGHADQTAGRAGPARGAVGLGGGLPGRVSAASVRARRGSWCSPAITVSPRPGCRRSRRGDRADGRATSTRVARPSTCWPSSRAPRVRVVDVAVDVRAPLRRSIGAYKVRRSSGNIAVEDALTADEARRRHGGGPRDRRRRGRRRCRPADRGRHGHRKHHGRNDVDRRDSPTPSPSPAVGRGTGIDDAGWARKTAAIRDALYRGTRVSADPVALLRVCGGRRPRRDGRVPGAGGGPAHPGAARRCRGDRGGAGRRAGWPRRERLVAGRTSIDRARPPAGAAQSWSSSRSSTLGCDSGEGTGAAVALPMLRAAIAALTSMATFDEASVRSVVIRSITGGFRVRHRVCRCGRALASDEGADARHPWSASALGGRPARWCGRPRMRFGRWQPADRTCSRSRRCCSPRAACTSTGWPTPSTASAATGRPSGRWQVMRDGGGRPVRRRRRRGGRRDAGRRLRRSATVAAGGRRGDRGPGRRRRGLSPFRPGGRGQHAGCDGGG